METTDFNNSLSHALQQDNAQFETDSVCRKHIQERLLSDDCPEAFREVLMPLAGAYSFPLKYGIEQPQSIQPVTSRPATCNSDILQWIIAGISTIVISILGKVLLGIPILGAGIGFLIGVCLAGFFGKRKTPAPSTPVATVASAVTKLYVATGVDEIRSHCDDYAGQLTSLAKELAAKSLKQPEPTDTTTDADTLLETKYYRLLEWFWLNQEERGDDTDLLKDIARILKKFNYEFVDYSGDNSYMFDQSAGNVTVPTTSVKALINSHTNECIKKGHVIMPMR